MVSHGMNRIQKALSRALVPVFVLGAVTTSASPASAQQTRTEGTVLKIDGTDIYIDLGAGSGVGAGSKLTLYHVIIAKNPVTGKSLRDRFPLGELNVLKTGEFLCIARATSALLKRIRVGDEVALASARRTFEDPWQTTIEERKQARIKREQAMKPRPPVDPAELIAKRKAEHEAAVARANADIAARQAVKEMWRTTLGKAPQDRIAMWTAFLAGNPSTPHADAIRAEITSLQAQIDAEEIIREQLAAPDTKRADMRIDRLANLEPELALNLNAPVVVRQPSRVYEGEPVVLSLTVLVPSAVERGWLYYRHANEDSFRRTKLQFDGDAYMRGAIPGDAIRPPHIQYFVEISDPNPDGTPFPVIGTQEVPRQIDVQKAVAQEITGIDDRSRVTLFTDYVDFDGGLSGGYDQYVHAEVDFMYRFFKPIYAVRVGFGTLGGIGGAKDDIDDSPTQDCTDADGNYLCRRLTFTYAYAEFEYRLKGKPISIMVRPQFGQGSRDSRRNTNADCTTGQIVDECDLFSDFGMRVRVRIGDERKTNLTLGIGLTQSVGSVFEAAYSWDVIPKFPIKISAQVTDQPVPEDFGVRLIGDVGWQRFSWFYPSIRIAVQARDVDHAGLSGGGAINFDW